MREERNALILKERVGGDALRKIGNRHGLSHEGVRRVVVREFDRHIAQLERDLRDATVTGEWPTFLVPFQDQTDWQTALAFFQRCLDALRARGWKLAVTTRHTPAGTAFMIETENA